MGTGGFPHKLGRGRRADFLGKLKAQGLAEGVFIQIAGAVGLWVHECYTRQAEKIRCRSWFASRSHSSVYERTDHSRPARCFDRPPFAITRYPPSPQL